MKMFSPYLLHLFHLLSILILLSFTLSPTPSTLILPVAATTTIEDIPNINNNNIISAIPAASTITPVPQCAWVFSAREGEALISVLPRQWPREVCAGRYFTITPRSPILPGFSVPSPHLTVVAFTPELTGLIKDNEVNVRYASQELSITCDVFTPVCEKAAVYYVIHGSTEAPTEIPTTSEAPTTEIPTTSEAPTTEIPTTSEAPTTEIPTTSEAPTTEIPTTESPTNVPNPLPVTCPASNVISMVETNISVATRLNPLQYIGNCGTPQRVVITSHNNSIEEQTNYFSVEKNTTLWFDHNTINKEEGIFSVNLSIYCNEVVSCSNIKMTVLVVNRPINPPPEIIPPNCSLTYGYRVNFKENAFLTIFPHTEDTCPTGSKTIFKILSPPKYNPGVFNLNKNTGSFNYTAPDGPRVTTDAFLFIISCNSDSDVTNLDVCVGRASIIITAAPEPPEEVKCLGNFIFSYNTCEGNSSDKNLYNLFKIANLNNNNDTSSFCPDGKYTEAKLKTSTTNGKINEFNNSTGEFQYISSGNNMDEFNFSLTCITGNKCHGTALLQPSSECITTESPTTQPTTESPEIDRPIYKIDNIFCRGTCNSAAWRSSPKYPNVFDVTDGPQGGREHITPRRDNKSPDSMDFEVHTDGQSLLIRAYTLIGNMAARFVTFEPLGGSTSPYLTSSYVPKGSNPSFNATCLDRQAKFGLASSIWLWDNDNNDNETNGEANLRGHINTETNTYKSGENYFQKFGGKHRDCDVFRIDPCKYAPMLTPSSSGTNSTIDWRLFVNDCDATWVGNISIESLRLLRNSVNGESLFKLVNGTELIGTIYTQVVKPGNWVPPYNGILTLQRAYTLRISLYRSIATDVELSLIELPSQKEKEEKETKKNISNIKYQEIKGSKNKNLDIIKSSTETVSSDNSFFNVSVDVRFVAETDPLTGERLYGYSLLLYPYKVNYSHIIYSVPTVVNLNASTLHVTYVELLNSSWSAPNPKDCPECTGKSVSCKGIGSGFSLNCDPIIKFEPIGNLSIFSQYREGNEESERYVNISFIARVVGKNTSNSASMDPQGNFALRIIFANNENVIINVQQSAYITGINSFMNHMLCRSSAYWPVPDPLGSSVPVKPFNSTQMLINALNDPILEEEKTEDKNKKPYYGPPKSLLSEASCTAGSNPQRPNHIILNSTFNTLYGDDNSFVGNKIELAMCATPDEHVYGVTDWVYVSLKKNLNLDFNSLSSEHMSLEYLILSIDKKDVLNVFNSNNNITQSNQRLHFVLDGASLPDDFDQEGFEEEKNKWMEETTVLKPEVFLPWEKYASYIRYRRIYVRTCPPNNTDISKCIIDPFNFAFVPGALLNRGSSVHATFYLHAAIRFTSSNNSAESYLEEIWFTIPVSAQISSALRFDRDVYTPHVVPAKSGRLSKKSATALFVILAIAIVAVLAAAFFIEAHYKRVLHSLKRRMRQKLASNGPNNNQNNSNINNIPGGSAGGGSGQRYFSPLNDNAGGSEVRKGINNNNNNNNNRNNNNINNKQQPSSFNSKTVGVSGIKTSYGVVMLEQQPRKEAKEELSSTTTIGGKEGVNTVAVRVEQANSQENAEDLK